MLLNIKNLSVKFTAPNQNSVLKNFSLEVAQNDKIAIIGETGSGKSIMLLSIIGLLPHNTEISGSIKYNNLDLLSLSRSEFNTIRGKEISYVPQGSGSSMNPLMKVGYQVSEPLYIHKICDKANAFKKAVFALQNFTINNAEERAKNYPHTFSGGMKQRALIAMGIIAEPQLILADEPTKGLDSKRIALVEDSFLKLKDKTYIVVTHDLNFAQTIADKISVMLDTYQVESGKTEEVFARPLHPYTEDIIQAMPENGLKYNQNYDLKLRLNKVAGECIYRQNCQYASAKCKQMPEVSEPIKGRKVRCWRYS